MRRAAVVAAAAAVLVAAPVASAAVSVDVGGKRCYAEGDTIDVNGTGYTPGGPARLSLERADGQVLESTEEPTAADDGTVSGGYTVDDETGWFGASASRFDMVLRLVDLTRLREGRPQTDPEVGATASFIFSRWAVAVRTRGGRIHPRRSATVRAVGYTNAIGKPLYAHWMRNGKRVHTRRLGLLRGACGDLRARLARGFPFRPVPAGSYEVRFAPSRTNARSSAITVRAARVRRTIR